MEYKLLEDKSKVKHKIVLIMSLLLSGLLLSGCGEDSELKQFKADIDSFCTNISELDTSINNIDAESETASQELLGYLDQLDIEFENFATIDFPEEFDYLEHLSDEASDYMKEAVSSYHDAYSNGAYNEHTAEYAHENYSRAYRRVQIIITFLHGEEPEDADLNIEYE